MNMHEAPVYCQYHQIYNEAMLAFSLPLHKNMMK